MPLRPAGWFLALFFFALLVADIIFGFVSYGWGDTWALWGPIAAIVGSWVIGLVGGMFSIFILKIVKFLSVLYVIGFAILAITSMTQGAWGTFGIAVCGAIATMFAGGFLIMIEQSIIQQSMSARMVAPNQYSN